MKAAQHPRLDDEDEARYIETYVSTPAESVLAPHRARRHGLGIQAVVAASIAAVSFVAGLAVTGDHQPTEATSPSSSVVAIDDALPTASASPVAAAGPRLPPPGGIPLNAAVARFGPDATPLAAWSGRYGDMVPMGTARSPDHWVWAIQLEWRPGCGPFPVPPIAGCPPPHPVTETAVVDYFTGRLIEWLFPAGPAP